MSRFYIYPVVSCPYGILRTHLSYGHPTLMGSAWLRACRKGGQFHGLNRFSHCGLLGAPRVNPVLNDRGGSTETTSYFVARNAPWCICPSTNLYTVVVRSQKENTVPLYHR